mmetsp:Transcript_99989/g.305642  ORF Transcript_99989/g.305642 Transcript_99989/m.305642 type:complete len:226 (+) Transcript_99989:245-922(+)
MRRKRARALHQRQHVPLHGLPSDHRMRKVFRGGHQGQEPARSDSGGWALRRGGCGSQGHLSAGADPNRRHVEAANDSTRGLGSNARRRPAYRRRHRRRHLPRIAPRRCCARGSRARRFGRSARAQSNDARGNHLAHRRCHHVDGVQRTVAGVGRIWLGSKPRGVVIARAALLVDRGGAGSEPGHDRWQHRTRARARLHLGLGAAPRGPWRDDRSLHARRVGAREA